jgi:hypothetical protein
MASKVAVQVGKTIDLIAEGSRASLPYPAAGYGGHELVVSPSGKYLALFLYSGQSEVGWELFELPTLRHIGGLPYVFGEGAAPVFSADEKGLAMLSTLRDIEPDDDDPDATVIDWAELRLQPLPTGALSTCTIQLRFEEPPEEREPEYPRIVHLGTAEVTMALPWGGQRTLPLPLPRATEIPGPSTEA